MSDTMYHTTIIYIMIIIGLDFCIRKPNILCALHSDLYKRPTNTSILSTFISFSISVLFYTVNDFSNIFHCKNT